MRIYVNYSTTRGNPSNYTRAVFEGDDIKCTVEEGMLIITYSTEKSNVKTIFAAGAWSEVSLSEPK